MALIGRNQDGTYATGCALCGNPLTEPIFATSHFIADPAHDLYRFSDAAMHWTCYAKWPHQARFASMYFEAALMRSETNPYWTVLLRSPDMLVLYGLAVDEVSVILKVSGTDIRIPRNEWQDWLSGVWRERCRSGLEYDAVAEGIPKLSQLSLAQPGAPPSPA